MDIKSGSKYPAGALSNFSPHPFVFRGVKVASMEGFVQSLKFKEPDMQKHICTLTGMAAKKSGSNKKWFKDQTLYWAGEGMERKSTAYQELLDEAYTSMFDQNSKARKALMATGSSTLTHNIGRIKKAETVLTRQEFCSRLLKNRNRIRNDTSFKDGV